MGVSRSESSTPSAIQSERWFGPTQAQAAASVCTTLSKWAVQELRLFPDLINSASLIARKQQLLRLSWEWETEVGMYGFRFTHMGLAQHSEFGILRDGVGN